MVQFYLPPDRWKSGASAARLEGDEARHARDAFRMEPGDQIRLFDGQGSAALGHVTAATKSALDIALDRRLPTEPPPRVHIDLAQALVPGETMDHIVRQSTELGVSRIWPIVCERSIVRLTADKRAAKQEHWKKIALAACKQCDRNYLPEIMPVISSRELIERFVEYDTVLVADPAESKGELDLGGVSPPKRARLLIAIGPEGDFSPEELKLFKARHARAVTLGPLILRSDTAAISAVSTLQYLLRRQ